MIQWKQLIIYQKSLFGKTMLSFTLAESIQNIDLKQYLNMEMLTEYAKGAINVVTSILIYLYLLLSLYIY